jgi:hypothetical protein
VYFLVNGTVVARGINNNDGLDPVEVVGLIPSDFSSNATVTVDFMIVSYSGPLPTYMKFVVFGQITSFEFPTNSATSFGHSNAALSTGVGAANFAGTPAFGVSPPIIESFSSA